MKFLSWMQSKLHGKVKFQSVESHACHSSKPGEPPEEISPALPHGLLAIGTFGNNDSDAGKVIDDDGNDPSPLEETEDSSPEDVSKLQEELNMEFLLQKSHLGGKEIEVLPPEELLSGSTSSEVDGQDDIGNEICSHSDEKEEGMERRISLMIGEWRDDGEKSNHKYPVVKKSISFLVKKMFVCGSGFATPASLPLPPPSLTDALQDSRMKKILRMLLHKKIHPQNNSQVSSLKRYIKEKEMKKKSNEYRSHEENNGGYNEN